MHIWENTFEEKDINQISFSVYSVIHKHAALKKLSKKEANFQSEPWISQGIPAGLVAGSQPARQKQRGLSEVCVGRNNFRSCKIYLVHNYCHRSY